ncbi:uncharacterized protein [Epargyreus clarus]|uniref:uncharacterized protein isoform X2 n=1 Tax=Epargyreus clarus TaxID=520877 RepID=UPI003C2B3FB4
MGGAVLYFISILFLLQCVCGYAQLYSEICPNITSRCTTQIQGQYADLDSCKVEYIPPDSSVCKKNLGPITNAENTGISLRPYLMPYDNLQNGVSFKTNYTVINITFTKINWKTMKFRFARNGNNVHCRNIALSNDLKFDEQSVLYYDCYWHVSTPNTKGQSHVLDFEATDNTVVNTGRFHFNIPSASMLSPNITEKDWIPFVYIEIMADKMRLHITPPPSHLKITNYHIQVIRNNTNKEFVEQNKTIAVKNGTEDTIFDSSLLKDSGWYYFVVMPIHDGCKDNVMSCKNVSSPTIVITNEVPPNMNICIASIATLVVAALFAYYIVLRLIRRYISNEIPPPTKVLVIYSPANRLHAECVASFVTYLRFEYGLDVMYDGDISTTSHGDPYIWAEEAIRLSTHVVYVVGPAEETNLYNNIYDKPIITAHKDVDILLLSLLKSTRVSRNPKDVMNVFFDHSNGQVPVETRHDKVYFLLKDWQKLISHLSRYLLPKKQIMRTEKGRSFLEDLTRAKKLLADKKDDVIVRCEKMGSIEKKVLL